jgi:two-component system sensor histidine kinase RegB
LSDSGAFSFISPARLGSSTWLLHLRSFAVVGQLLTIIATALFTSLDIPYAALLVLVALTALSNMIYAWWLRRDQLRRVDLRISPDEESNAHQWVALVLMVVDLATLTGMLSLSGGASNPFSFFYFVNLAVGGVMIRRQAAWVLAIGAIIGYAVVLMFSPSVAGINSPIATGTSLQTLGLMFAFSACAFVVTYFVTRTAGELRRSQQQLLTTQAARDASQRLEGLTTLAAGAAHELATPLSTIDVIVRELSRHLEGCEKPDSVTTDLELIDGQLEMCRQILQRMRSAAGDSMAPLWAQTTVGDLIDATLEGIRDPHRVDVPDNLESVESTELWVPQEAVAQAVRNLVHNGLDASGHEGRVQLVPSLVNGSLELRVIDEGTGMTDEVLQRALDPFFTTKEPGRGIGLGLFLTRNVISELGGQLQFRSKPGMGTEALVTIPLQDPNQLDSADAKNHRYRKRSGSSV